MLGVEGFGKVYTMDYDCYAMLEFALWDNTAKLMILH